MVSNVRVQDHVNYIRFFWVFAPGQLGKWLAVWICCRMYITQIIFPWNGQRTGPVIRYEFQIQCLCDAACNVWAGLGIIDRLGYFCIFLLDRNISFRCLYGFIFESEWYLADPCMVVGWYLYTITKDSASYLRLWWIPNLIYTYINLKLIYVI